MKPIKFDLKLNNGEITLAYLKDIEANLTPALFQHFHTGKLAKWLRVRKLDEHAEKMEALRTQHIEDKNELDVKLFKSLCEIFVSEVSEEDAREAMKDYQPANLEQDSNDEEIEQLKAEIEALKSEIDTLRNPPKPKENTVENFIIHDNGTVTDTKTGLMWKQQHEPEKLNWNNAMKHAKQSNFVGYSDWRLPTIDELKSLIDERFKPTINTIAFPNTPDSYFWSSSLDASASGNAWIVSFSGGYAGRLNKNYGYYVRLVRG